MPATVVAVGGTGDTLDTTGATLIVAVNSAWSGSPSTFADFYGNTYLPLTLYGVSSYYGRMFYCENPIVGPGHWFNGSGSFAKFSLIAFAGAGAFISEGGFAANASSIQPGVLTPPAPNCIVVAGVTFEPTSLVGIDGGFTVANTEPNSGGVGASIAYLIQTTAAAANPTWTMAGAANLAAPMAVFAAAAPPPVTHTKLYLTRSPSPYTPPTVRGAWNSVAGGIAHFLDWTKVGGGLVTSLTLSEASLVSPFAQLMYRGVSGPLAAQTFGGTVDVRISVDTNSANADFFWFLHLYVTVGDSDTVRGDLLTNYGESTNEWPSSGDLGDTLASPQALAALGVLDGDRLVAEIGFIARNIVATNYQGQIFYGTEALSGASVVSVGDQTAGGSPSLASHLVFSSAITELSALPGNLVSQAVAEVASFGSGTQRLSHLLPEVASEGKAANRFSLVVVEIASPAETAPQRHSQVLTELAHDGTAANRLSQVIVEAATSAVIEAVFRLGHGRILAWLQTFHKDAVGNPVQYLWGTYELWDKTSYYGGRKEARLLSIGYTDRALTGQSGEFRAGTCSLRFSDADYKLRGWVDSVTQYGIINAEAVVWVISEEDWRARKNPIKYFHGRISRYRMEKGLEASLDLADIFGIPFEQALPLPKISADFPSPPNPNPVDDPEWVWEWKDMTVPLLLGQKSGDGSGAAPPVFVQDEAGRGTIGNPAQPLNSYGDMPGGIPVPVGLTHIEVEDAGNLMLSVHLAPGSAWANRWSLQITRVRGGLQSDPTPFYPGSVYHELDHDHSAIHVSCASTDHLPGDVYRFYLGTSPVGGGRPRFSHYIQTADPATGVTFTDKELSPGGVPIPDAGPHGNNRYWCCASWVDGEGETRVFPIQPAGWPLAFILSPGYDRPCRFALQPPPVGTSHGYMYISDLPGFPGHPTLRFVIDITNLNSNGDVVWEWDLNAAIHTTVERIGESRGVLPVIPLGSGYADAAGYSGFYAFLVGYGVWDSIISLYQLPISAEADAVPVKVSADHFGVDWYVPGKPGFSPRFATHYLERNGRRYTVFYGLGPHAQAATDGSRPITVNARGIKTINGDGGTCITNGFEQLAWFLDNWWLPDVAQPKVGGDWNANIPTFADGTPKRNERTFEVAAAEALEVMPAGVDRAIYVAAAETPLTGSAFMKDVLIGLDASFGQNLRGQAVLYLLPPHPPSAVSSGHITHINDIIDEDFDIEDDPSTRVSAVEYSFELDPSTDEYRQKKILPDPDSQAAYADTIVPMLGLEYRSVSSAAVASQLAERALMRNRRPERIVRVPRPFFAVHDDLGDRKHVTHPEGAGIGGYQARFLMINRVQPDHDMQKVTASYWDLDWINASLTSSIPLLEDFMADLDLGGSREISAKDGENDGVYNFVGEVVPFDFRVVRIPWTRLVGWTAKARVFCLTAAGTVTPRIRNLTTNTDAATGTPYAGATFALQTLTIAAPAPRVDQEYVLFLDEAGCTALDIKGFGAIRTDPA